jgi:hypothetical protein
MIAELLNKQTYPQLERLERGANIGQPRPRKSAEIRAFPRATHGIP